MIAHFISLCLSTATHLHVRS